VQKIAAMEVAAKEVEEMLEREWQIQLQVSTGISSDFDLLTCCTERFGGISDDAREPLLTPFTIKGKEVSFLFLSVCSGTENWNRKSNLGPTGSSPATGANGTSCTASGCLRHMPEELRPMCSTEDHVHS